MQQGTVGGTKNATVLAITCCGFAISVQSINFVNLSTCEHVLRNLGSDPGLQEQGTNMRNSGHSIG